MKLLYGIAAKRDLVPSNPVTLASPSGVKTSDVQWLSPRAFRLWRNVGLSGMLPSGLEDEARPFGRPGHGVRRLDVLQRPEAPRRRHPLRHSAQTHHGRARNNTQGTHERDYQLRDEDARAARWSSDWPRLWPPPGRRSPCAWSTRSTPPVR
ncbi:hypothetical protein [Streptomyces sp. NPDC057287]|uniref:hypothetical protein n=1 Tax=Streptomyces sp. NPDC057287 TaxID=3346086 RepID=UPI00362A0B36